jgi:lactobin A/cerein 7B family class IIb bacteriocin
MKNLKELNQEEVQNINGGFFPLLIAAAEVYLGICAGAAAAGAGTAFVQNQYDKYHKYFKK